MDALRKLPAAAFSILVGLAPAQEFADPGAQKVAVAARFDPTSVQANGIATLVVSVTVEPGWHVYGAKEEIGTPTSLKVEAAALEPVGRAVVPDGARHDEGGLTSWWLEGTFEIRQRLRVKKGTPPGPQAVSFTIDYMACTPQLCDPPAKEKGRAELTVLAGEAPDEVPPPVADGSGPRDEGLLAFLLAAIGAGLFALAMPCTYPMIPITISFFTKQAEARGGRVLPLSLTYGLGIVLMFVLIGVAIGGPVQAFATHPVTNLVIAILFVVFGLSLFGLINLQPPQALMSLAGKASQHGGYAGVFLMGATLVITSFTCTVPFIGGLLGVGASKGMGVVALGMAVFGLTMAIPFVVLSLTPGRMRALPRSGEWMNVLKVFFGFVEIAAALKFLSNADLVWQWQALPRDLFLWLWAGTFAVAGLYLLGMIRLKGEEGSIGPGRLTSGLASLLFAVYCVFGALGNPLDWVMTAIVPNYTVTAQAGDGGGKLAPKHTIVKDDHEAAVKLAAAEGKLVLINFTGHT